MDTLFALLAMLQGMAAGLSGAFDLPVYCSSYRLPGTAAQELSVAYHKSDLTLNLDDLNWLLNNNVCTPSNGVGLEVKIEPDYWRLSHA
jgi:hypothetical protein